MKTINRNKLILLFSLAYMVSYMTRINYGAVISEMESDIGFSKQLLSMAVTGSFITYGSGQIISGILGDKLSPKKLLLAGLTVTALMNLILPFCASPYLMTVIWSVNGFAQAFMWPPLVKLMVKFFRREEYSRASVSVLYASNIGTIIIYLLSPIIISLLSWKGVFWFSALCGFLMMFVWIKFCPNVRAVNKSTSEKAVKIKSSKIFTSAFFVLAMSIIICGILRDGVATWMPSLVSESFNLSNSLGILTGAVLPIFGMVCYNFALALYRKKFKNPVMCAGIIFLIGVLSSVVLWLMLDKNAIVSVVAISLLNGAMHGVNLMLIGMLPSFYSKTSKVSTVSGILNAFVYIGSAVSTYGIALLTENYGWGTTVFVWFILSILGTAICFSVANKWKNKV